MQNNVLSAAAVPLFLEAKRLFCSVRFQKKKQADQRSRLASVAPLGHDKRSVLTVDPWPNCQIAKQHKLKNIKHNYLEYLFAQQNATNNNRKTVHNDHFFRNKSKQKNKQNRRKNANRTDWEVIF